MKNPVVVIAIIIIISILSIGAYLLSQNSPQSNTMMEKNGAMMSKDDVAVSDENTMAKTNSSYVQYSKEVFESSVSSRRVLFFYASWCPTCIPADAAFSANSGMIPDDVTLIRVNYNDPETDQEEKDLARKYGITYQHTFVQIDSAGKEIAKWNGGQIDELLSNLR